MAASGLIFNIQKFSLHDGPGVRTTVFLKGCTLRCLWCHNPEGRSFAAEALHRGELCTGCAACAESCPTGAITVGGGAARTDPGRCTLCGACLTVCPQGAREIAGRSLTVDEVLETVLQDRVFYERSGGGVTFSGGEALAQIDFLAAALAACREAGLHTAVDTAGHVPWSHFERILADTDLFLYDLKTLDGRRHRELTGAGNDLVLDNLRRLSAAGERLWIRVPLIAGLNDGPAEVERLLEFLSGLRFRRVHLLPYHALGAAKAARLPGADDRSGLRPPSPARLAEILERFAAAGVTAVLGG